MKKLTASIACVGLALGVWLGAAASVEAGVHGRVYVRVGPPAAVVQVRSVAPSRHHVWVAGYHRWSGSAYVWVDGRWVAPPRAGAVWVAGRWQHTRHGYVWVAGFWR